LVTVPQHPVFLWCLNFFLKKKSLGHVGEVVFENIVQEEKCTWIFHIFKISLWQ
jgi:hypothetical protein